MHEQRRAFLKTAAFTALSESRIPGANDRIRAAGIGNGIRGTHILGLIKEAENTEIVAVSDIHPPRMAAARQKPAPARTRIQIRRGRGPRRPSRQSGISDSHPYKARIERPLIGR